MPVRLLQITNSLIDDDINAVAVRVSQAVARDGMHVTLLGLQGNGSLQGPMQKSGLHVRTIQPVRHATELLYQTRRVIQDLKPDIVHTWTDRSNRLGRFAAMTTGVPRIISSWRTVPRRPSWSSDALERSLMRRTETCVVNSSTALECCRAHGLPSGKLHLIKDGVPKRTPLTAKERIDVRTRLGLSPDAKLVGIVGPLVPRRRVKDAIWSADLLRVFYPDVCCWVIGDGPSRWRLERYTRQVGAADRTQFLGCPADWVEIIGASDCLCQTGDRASMPMAVLEAMSAGVPVVASDIAGHRELMDAGRTGMLVPVGNRGEISRKIYNAIEDLETSGRMISAARKHVHEHCSADAMIESYRQLYQQSRSTVKQRRRGRRASSPTSP